MKPDCSKTYLEGLFQRLICVVLIILAQFLLGCRIPVPLISLPESQRSPIHVVSIESGTPHVSSHLRHPKSSNREEFSPMQRFLGIDDGTLWLGSIRRNTERFEMEVFEQSILTALSRVDTTIHQTNRSAATLFLKYEAFGMVEQSKGWFAPFATAEAQLRDRHGTQVWLARAEAVGTTRRRAYEYEKNPQFYRDDFQEVVDSIASQLISGPILGFASIKELDDAKNAPVYIPSFHRK